MIVDVNKIYCGDCLELMPHIVDKSVDMVLCDLPYQVLHKNNPNAQWDRIIPFEPLWEQYKRIIKDNGAIVLFAQGMFTAQLMMSNPKMWRYNLVWDKKRVTGFLNANRMPMRCHEDICVFYKKLPTYNPQMESWQPNHSQGNGKHKETNNCYGNYGTPSKSGRVYGTVKRLPDRRETTKYPKSIIRIRKEHESKVFHPTQKPVDLLRYLIRTYTNENDVVLDNCMGSGSTIVASVREQRQYIGIEKDEHYFEMAKQRIENELMQPKSLF